jgi:hypothetical protein
MEYTQSSEVMKGNENSILLEAWNFLVSRVTAVFSRKDVKVNIVGGTVDNLVRISVPGILCGNFLMRDRHESKLTFVFLEKLRNALGCNYILVCGLYSDDLLQSVPIKPNYFTTLE